MELKPRFKFITAGAVTILIGVGWAFLRREDNDPAVGLPSVGEVAGRTSPGPKSRTKTSELIAELETRKKLGTLNGTGERDYLDEVFDKISNRSDLSTDELLHAVLENFPSELQKHYIDLIFQNLSREDPLSAVPYLEKIPPGEILTRCAEVIAAASSARGLTFEQVSGWIRQIDYAEDKAAAYGAFISNKENWSDSSFETIDSILSQLPNDSLKQSLISSWLQGNKNGSFPMEAVLSHFTEGPTREGVRANLELQMKPTTKSDTAKGQGANPPESPRRQAGEGLRAAGAGGFSMKNHDYGFDGIVSRGGTPDEKSEVVSGWYWKFLGEKAPEAIAFFKDHPELHTEDLMDAAAGAALNVDRELLKMWITDNQENSKVIEIGITKWLQTNSVEASKWISEMPEGHLRNHAIRQLINWSREKGDHASAEAWEKALQGTPAP